MECVEMKNTVAGSPSNVRVTPYTENQKIIPILWRRQNPIRKRYEHPDS